MHHITRVSFFLLQFSFNSIVFQIRIQNLLVFLGEIPTILFIDGLDHTDRIGDEIFVVDMRTIQFGRFNVFGGLQKIIGGNIANLLSDSGIVTTRVFVVDLMNRFD
jgi:hypothetical protein